MMDTRVRKVRRYTQRWTLGHMLALRVSPANGDDRKEVERLSGQIQQAAGESAELAYADRGYTGEKATGSAAEHGFRLEVVKHRRPSVASSSC